MLYCIKNENDIRRDAQLSLPLIGEDDYRIVKSSGFRYNLGKTWLKRLQISLVRIDDE